MNCTSRETIRTSTKRFISFAARTHFFLKPYARLRTLSYSRYIVSLPDTTPQPREIDILLVPHPPLFSDREQVHPFPQRPTTHSQPMMPIYLCVCSVRRATGKQDAGLKQLSLPPPSWPMRGKIPHTAGGGWVSRARETATCGTILLAFRCRPPGLSRPKPPPSPPHAPAEAQKPQHPGRHCGGGAARKIPFQQQPLPSLAARHND